ncbi:50S ribosomal protein L3 [bacterium]|nr:50S ribosomal protein L3 [bacterium]MBT5988194.1 50S ribosomal protein L3 [bacterium]
MKKVIIGKKIGMTQLIDKEGNVDAATVLKVEDSVVLQVIENEDDKRIVVGYGKVKEKKITKPKKGVFAARKLTPLAFIKEYVLDKGLDIKENEPLPLTVFEEKEIVDVRGTSKGRGFSGTIKRWNFKRGPMAHGSKSHRIPGSIGGGTDPGKVFKGQKMAGHHGDKGATIKNLKVLKIDEARGLLVLKGAIPGKKGNIVEVIKK